jgi:hypothetical protein
MYFNRFDIVEAYYLFLSEYHEGQASRRYARLCKMQRYFKPAWNFNWDSLSDNGKEIYYNLVAWETPVPF